jgi:hypothetical protein
MSSTDEAKARRFWKEHLAPAADRLKARGAGPLDVSGVGSSWQPPHDDVPELSELTLEGLGEELRARFEAADLAELAEIVPELMKLAREMEPSTKDDGEVDPFVYVMH